MTMEITLVKAHSDNGLEILLIPQERERERDCKGPLCRNVLIRESSCCNLKAAVQCFGQTSGFSLPHIYKGGIVLVIWTKAFLALETRIMTKTDRV